MDRVIDLAGAVAVALVLGAVFAPAPIARQDTLYYENARILDWAGLRAIGKADGTCPTGWSADTAFRGRYVVGLPMGGTAEATEGAALMNGQLDRGGLLHTHPFTPPTISYTNPTATYTPPTVSQTNLLSAYTQPTVSFTPPTATVTNSAHTHGYEDRESGGDISAGFVRTSGVTFSEPSYTTASTSSVAQATTATLSGGTLSLTGGSLSMTGGAVSLSGGSVSISGGSISTSGGGVVPAIENDPPAPYIQVTICEYDPA